MKFSLIFILVLITTTYGDMMLKKASSEPSFFLSPSFGIGVGIYILQAFFWTMMYKYMEFGTMAVVYSVGLVIFSVLTGMWFFHESLTLVKGVGISLALLSLILMSISSTS